MASPAQPTQLYAWIRGNVILILCINFVVGEARNFTHAVEPFVEISLQGVSSNYLQRTTVKVRANDQLFIVKHNFNSTIQLWKYRLSFAHSGMLYKNCDDIVDGC